MSQWWWWSGSCFPLQQKGPKATNKWITSVAYIIKASHRPMDKWMNNAHIMKWVQCILSGKIAFSSSKASIIRAPYALMGCSWHDHCWEHIFWSDYCLPWIPWLECPCHAHQVDNPSQAKYYWHSENWVDIEKLILDPKSLFQ